MDHFQIQEHFVLLLFNSLNEMTLEIRIRPFLTKLVLHILLKHVKPCPHYIENVWKFNFRILTIGLRHRIGNGLRCTEMVLLLKMDISFMFYGTKRMIFLENIPPTTKYLYRYLSRA